MSTIYHHKAGMDVLVCKVFSDALVSTIYLLFQKIVWTVWT